MSHVAQNIRFLLLSGKSLPIPAQRDSFQYKKAFDIPHLPTTTKGYLLDDPPYPRLAAETLLANAHTAAHFRELLPWSKDHPNFIICLGRQPNQRWGAGQSQAV